VKAIRVHAPGGLEALTLEDIPVPTPGPGQALVRVEAAGLNFIDVYHRIGLYKVPYPYTLGQEGAGAVESVGPDVRLVQPGERVAWTSLPGAYADYIVAPAERLVSIPAGVTVRQAAAVMLQGLTAEYLTTSTFPLSPGDTCLLHAAAGGVGLLVCQMARLRGARVIGTVSTEAKAALAREAGASEVILYTERDFAVEVKRIMGGQGVDVVYDSVGKTTFDKSLDCLRPRGLLVLFGQSSGPVPPFNLQILSQKGSLFLTRPSLVHYTATRSELVGRAAQVLGWVADGTVKVRVDREYPLRDAAEAHRALESRKTAGKVLLIP
jgi:NADPH:quinone reductase